MIVLQQYYSNVIKHELLRRFQYKNINNIPRLKKIILNFGCKNSNFKDISTALLALELISGKKGRFTVTKKFNLLLKIKKGNPVGCKVTLYKNYMFLFLNKLIFEIFPKLKTIRFIKLKLTDTISYTLKNTLIFSELEKNYYLFNKLPNLHVTLVTTAKSRKELMFLLNSLKIPTVL